MTVDQLHVADVMIEDTVAVRMSTPFKEVARVLIEHDLGAVPVIDDDGHVSGVISAGDLLAKERSRPDPGEARGPLVRHERDPLFKADAVTASRLATTPAVTLTPDARLSAAARLMRRHNVRRAPVVDERDRLVGSVGRTDLLKPFLRSDADIGADIVRDILGDELRVDPARVDVVVEDGVVTLGELDTPADIEDAVHLAFTVEGVVDVVDRLRYRRAAASSPPPGG